MTTRAVLICLLAVGTAAAGMAQEAPRKAPANSLQLTLPDEFYGVVGVPMHVYFQNLIVTPEPARYQFQVRCPLGASRAERWSVTPRNEDVGEHRFSVTVRALDGTHVAHGSARFRVVPPDAGKGGHIKLLVIGDSLTNATQYPNELARLLSQPNNPQWKMLGTHRPRAAAAGVAHEGYGGWTWQRFVSQYEPEPDGTNRKRSSPFVFLGDSGEHAGKPTLDVARYFRERCGGELPDFVVIMLGINDCFSAPADDPTGIDARIEAMFVHADRLLTALRQAAPDAAIGICLTTPPNARQSAFEANYGSRYTRWGWKRIQHRLVQRQLARYSNREREQLFVVPTQLNLDPVDGYPENNAVHPNSEGYQQIGASIYCWLKHRLSSRPAR